MSDLNPVFPRPLAHGGRLAGLIGEIPAWRWLAGAILLCAVLGTWHIGRASLWTDEVFSRYYYDLFGLHYLLGDGLKIEPTPPTYEIVLEAWMRVFGDSESALRSLSVLAYLASLPVVFLLGREVGGRRVGILAAFLMAVSPMGIYYAQEARVYAMLALPCSVLLWAMAVFLRARRDRAAIGAYVLAGATLLYLHASMPFLLVSCAVAGAMLIAWERRVGWMMDFACWAAMNAAVVALSLPYTHLLLSVSHQGGLDWMPPLELRGVVSVLSILVTGMLTPRAWPAVPLAVLALGVLGASLVIRPVPARVLVVLTVVPALFLALVCLASLVRPMLLPRLLFWMVVPLSVLAAGQIASGVGDQRARWPALAVGVSFGLAVVVGLFYQETAPYGGKEPWRQAFAYMRPHYQPGDLVVISPESNAMIPKYYAPEMTHLRIWDAGLPATAVTGANAMLGAAPITQPEIERDIEAGGRVWMMTISMDVKYTNLLKRVAVPAYDATWSCGRSVCVEITGWGVGHG